MKLYLYLVSRTDFVGYDEYDGFVIAAPNAAAARHTHPNNRMPVRSSWSSKGGTWPVTPEALKVRKIGVAAAGVKPKVVLASFNAG